MKGWLADFLRTGWAFFHWNIRKSVFVLRRRRGQCPCHNPSDSGAPMQTGCEAVVGWAKPARFRRVCPLLRRNEAGFWVCSVPAAAVRPFWGRALAYGAGLIASLWILLAALAFGGFRLIGYRVSVRQIAWPPAWHELQAVRAELFIRQARESYAQGRVREAINGLSIAYQLDPGRYEVGMMLAQFYQAGNPVQADELYRKLLGAHPDRRSETARAWFRSLLARGRIKDLAVLARHQLAEEPEQAAAWTHALLFATRRLHDNGLLVQARTDAATPAAARAVIDLALRVRALPPAGARRLLRQEPLVAGFAYDGVYRVDALLHRGYPRDALEMLAQVQTTLESRDFARLVLAAYGELHNQPKLAQEFSALLAPQRQPPASVIALLAVHLVGHPDPNLLRMVIDALPRMPRQPADAGIEAALAVFCAAGVQGDAEGMREVKKLITDTFALNPSGLGRLELFFLGKSANQRIETLLPGVTPLSLELNYALLDRYLGGS